MPSQRGQSSQNILTTGTPWLALTGDIWGCLLWVKSLISYSVSITTVLHTIWGLYASALWRHSAVCTNCTALKGKKFLLTSGKGNMYWQYCGWDATKHHKIRECFSMALSSKDLLCFANKLRCIQSCNILHMQNIACVYNHWRLIVNISNKRFSHSHSHSHSDQTLSLQNHLTLCHLPTGQRQRVTMRLQISWRKMGARTSTAIMRIRLSLLYHKNRIMQHIHRRITTIHYTTTWHFLSRRYCTIISYINVFLL